MTDSRQNKSIYLLEANRHANSVEEHKVIYCNWERIKSKFAVLTEPSTRTGLNGTYF